MKHIDRLADIARKGAGVGNGRYRLAAGILYKGKLRTTACNIYKTHPLPIKMGGQYGYLHAECHAIIKQGLDNCKGCDLVVVRCNKKGHLTMSKPCEICSKLCKHVGIRRIHYTDWEGRLVSEVNY